MCDKYYSNPDFAGVHDDESDFTIFRCISGSRAYGTTNAQSDTDIRGVFVLPCSAYLNLDEPPAQLANDSHDIAYYSLKRFVELASVANPNFLEMLFMPADCVLYEGELWKTLVQRRELFLSKQAFDSHISYAAAQIKRSRGQNKWVNNPKPQDAPIREDYCWVVFRGKSDSGMPMRPVKLADSGLDKREIALARLEHAASVYRVYPSARKAKGLFANGRIECESIALEQEASCLGLLIFNEAGYEQDSRDHRHYWKWRSERNEHRWLSQEQGLMDYDAKNLMHTFRLILSARNLFREGVPQVRFDGEDLALLMDIRGGKFTYEELMDMSEELIRQTSELCERSSLPERADMAEINKLLHKSTVEWEGAQNAG